MKLIAASVLIVCAAGAVLAQRFTPVTGFSLDKYLGTWYEVARMPVSFEKGLSRVTATYSLREDGKVSVANRGVKKNGKEAVAHGKAKFGAAKETGYLRVSFFGPFYADYIIVDLDSAYQHALVAGSSDKYLWILSRTPHPDSLVVQRLVARAQTLGYDTAKLIMTPQKYE